MKIVYCADKAIYKHLPTALNSLIKNNPKIEKIYLLIEDDTIDYICHPKIEFVNLNRFDFVIRNGFNCTKKFPYMAMVRCYFTKILNEDKVIYLDVDTIVDGDISDLWNFNIGGNYIAARAENESYFNSGVLLMNLKLIKSHKLDDILMRLLRGCRFAFPDQDAMNLIFKNHIAHLPNKFNQIGGNEVYDGELVIRHFAGIVKPWKDGATEKDKALWNKYKVEAIWKLKTFSKI